ncbi:fumarylacetoacetate hydrolase family protein [Mycobacterium sp. Marseille-P9652]|uniref:fumarylacetoacetate hydrolase family protein n=1 Tax=Mycobacterium sp. Marseille-P9652 TaxID=2654950 RepID=UPI001E40A67E|nr:fumarylacetoacetate hydrolase family protein [Mycobacterium sp. Marseille-P9652]
MQLFTTTEGVVRRSAEATHLLPDLASLQHALSNGLWDSVADLPGIPVELESQLLQPPVRPETIAIVGLNYASHAKEVSQPLPQAPLFGRIDGGVVGGPEDRITPPAHAGEKVDYEGEIAVVISRPAYQVDATHAWEFVAGLTAVNDVTARDLQLAAAARGDMDGVIAAKAFPGFKPIGPGVLVTAQPPTDVKLVVRVNGELRQRAKLSELLFDIPTLVEAVTASVPLQPGDLICTGSPAGVGLATERFLAAGDVIEVTVGDLPPLRNVFESPKVAARLA